MTKILFFDKNGQPGLSGWGLVQQQKQPTKSVNTVDVIDHRTLASGVLNTLTDSEQK